MGACSSKRKAILLHDESLSAYHHQLIEDIYHNAFAIQEKRLPLNPTLGPSCRALLEFLENNRIRLNDTLKAVQKRMIDGTDQLVLQASILILQGITETIIKHLQHSEPESEGEDDQTDQSVPLQTYDHQNVSKVIQAQQQIVNCMCVLVDSKLEFMHAIYPTFIAFLRSFTPLMNMHYDQHLKRIAKCLQDVVYGYIVPKQVQPKTSSQRRTTSISKNMQSKLREHYIEKIVTVITQAQFLDTMELYQTMLGMSLRAKQSGSLYRNEQEQAIFETLIQLYTEGKIDLEPSSINSPTFLGRLQGPLKSLLQIYQEKCSHQMVEFLDSVLLNYNPQLWCQQVRVESLFTLMLRNQPNNALQQCMLDSLSDFIEGNLTKMKDVPVSQFDQWPAQVVNEMQTKQFNHYLSETTTDISKLRTFGQSACKSRSEIIYPHQCLVTMKTAVKCLQLVLMQMQSMEVLFFQSERSIKIILKVILVAQQCCYVELQMQAKMTLQCLMTCLASDLTSFISIIYQMVAFAQGLLAGEGSLQPSRRMSFDEVPDDIDSGHGEQMQRVSLVLEMVHESLMLVDAQFRCIVDDELIYALLSMADSHVYSKVIAIITAIVSRINTDQSFTTRSNAQVFKLSDSAAGLYLIKFYHMELANIARGLANNNSVFILIQVVQYLSDHQQGDVIAAFVWYLRDQLHHTDLKPLVFTMSMFAVGLLALHVETPLLGVRDIASLSKGHLNDILHFKLQQRADLLPSMLRIEIPRTKLDLNLVLKHYYQRHQLQRQHEVEYEEVELRTEQHQRFSPYESQQQHTSLGSNRFESFGAMLTHMRRAHNHHDGLLQDDYYLI